MYRYSRWKVSLRLNTNVSSNDSLPVSGRCTRTRLQKLDNVDCMHKVWQLFDARHGVKKRCLIRHRVILALIIRCHVWHRFLTPCLASKSCQTSCMQSTLSKFCKRGLQQLIPLWQDVMAAGRGAMVGTSMVGYSVGQLHLPDDPLPWETQGNLVFSPFAENGQRWLHAWSLLAFWRQTWRQKTMPDMASNNQC